MDRLLDVLAALCVLLIILVLSSVRRAHIRVEYSVTWLGAAITFLVLSRSPDLLESIAGSMGITYAPLAVLLIAGVVFLVMFYRFSVIVSKLKDDNIALAQRVAILEYRLEASQQGNRQV
jgi:hypothetical protein